MYWCNECKEVYPDEDLEVMDISEDEEWTRCGHCESTNLADADRCRCGEWKNPSEEFCEWCNADMTSAAVTATEIIKEIYQLGDDWKAKEALKDLLDEIYGG